MEEEEEEDEDEKHIDSNTEDTTNSVKADINDSLKEQLRNRDRPTNPMRKLDSPSDPIIEEEEKDDKEKESKEGILIVEDEQESDDNSGLKEELEGDIADSKSGRTSKDPEQEELIKFNSNDVESVEKSDQSSDKPHSNRLLSSENDKDMLRETTKESPAKGIDYDLLEQLPELDRKDSDEGKSNDSFDRDHDKRFPTLSDDGDLPDIDDHKKLRSPGGSETNKEELKTEDLGFKEPTSSAKKKDKSAENFLKDSTDKPAEPFEFSEDSKDEIEHHDSESAMSNQNYDNLYEQFPGEVSIITRSRSEDWGGAGYNDYYGSNDSQGPLKKHYTEADLSNIELVEEGSDEGEESEISNEGEIDDAYTGSIQIAQ